MIEVDLVAKIRIEPKTEKERLVRVIPDSQRGEAPCLAGSGSCTKPDTLMKRESSRRWKETMGEDGWRLAVIRNGLGCVLRTWIFILV